MRHKKFSLILAVLFLFTISGNVFAQTNISKEPPKIYGSAAITMDAQTGEIIYAKDIDGKQYKQLNNTKGMYPASVTKLMTALLFAENKDKKGLNVLNYTKSAKEQPKYSLNTDYPNINFNIGKPLSVNDVMNALLLYSANDIAYTIAGNIGKTDSYDENSKQAVDNFRKMMNDKAAELKMKNTHFITANGLHDDNHYTTPYDLTLLARAALKNKWVAKTMNTKKGVLKIDGKTIPIENRNKLLGENINGAVCIGGKTGYTSKSGRCLVAIFEKDGRKVIGVVMHSIYDAKDSFVFQDMKKIIDWSFNVKPVNYMNKNTTIKTATLKYKPFKFFGPEKTLKVPLILKENITYYNNSINKKEFKTKIDTSNLTFKNLSSEKPVSKLIVSEREAVKSYDLYTNVSKSQIFKDNILLYVGLIVGLIVIIILIMFIVSLIKNGRRRKRNRYWR
ncbi:D-alanyl-D-alanine carboxypeptidase family protein [Haloimpatiens sp. FM7330]|uniref:D-alanyl-D-alanine carboxypeptidase family protein n=1 Tax=Haloimpatiens sp. FM7330 TaxID=3298610 RepID=UPI00362D1CAE